MLYFVCFWKPLPGFAFKAATGFQQDSYSESSLSFISSHPLNDCRRS